MHCTVTHHRHLPPVTVLHISPRWTQMKKVQLSVGLATDDGLWRPPRNWVSVWFLLLCCVLLGCKQLYSGRGKQQYSGRGANAADVIVLIAFCLFLLPFLSWWAFFFLIVGQANRQTGRATNNGLNDLDLGVLKREGPLILETRFARTSRLIWLQIAMHTTKYNYYST